MSQIESTSTRWILTAYGTQHFLGGPEAATNDYDIRWIAHACAQENRYTGHCNRPLCVAEHQLICADIAAHLQLPKVVQLACLMHDAHEAITGDCTSPVKAELGQAWHDFEAPHATAVRRWFGLTATFTGYRAQIRQIDYMALATERRDLMNWEPGVSAPWAVLDTPGAVVPPADWIDLNTTWRRSSPWYAWKDLYLQRFHQLRGDIAADATALISQPHQAKA